MGFTQPEVSRLFKGHFRDYSVRHLIAFLTAFGRDEEIVSSPRASTGLGGQVNRPAKSRVAPARLE